MNIESYDSFLNESEFFNGVEFLSPDEIMELPAFKKMDSRFGIDVWSNSPKTVSFKTKARKITYQLTVSKSGVITYGTLKIYSPDNSTWKLNFLESWDNIIDLLEIYCVSMNNSLSISQVKKFIEGSKALDPILQNKLIERKCDNGETHFDVLKEKAIKYSGKEKIIKLLSDVDKKGEGIIKTLRPILDSDEFKKFESFFTLKYYSNSPEKLSFQIVQVLPNRYYGPDTNYYHFVANPVKGFKRKPHGVNLIGTNDERVMVKKFMEYLIKDVQFHLEQSSRYSRYSLSVLNLSVVLNVLNSINDGKDIEEIGKDVDHLLYNSINQIFKTDISKLYIPYLESIKEGSGELSDIFDRALDEKKRRRLFIGSVFDYNGIDILKTGNR